MQVADLESRIHHILSAPGTDLGTISAKRVRRQLLDDTTVPVELVKGNKSAIDDLISVVFAKVSEETGFQQAARADNDVGEELDAESREGSALGKRRYASSGAYGEEEDPEPEPERAASPPPKKKSRKSKGEMSDAELAKMLSDELNSRPRSSRSGATGVARGRGRGGKANGTKRRKAKSSEMVDSGDEGSDVPKKKRAGGGGGFSKPYALSEPLAGLLGVDALSRPQVVKGLWDYIKLHEMQNPSNKREILCDDKFKAVFGTEKIDMFKMNKELSRHLTEHAAA
ncbi:SWIB-domain-containing protein [Auriscalpium vulgare]|uniref:SWIB-domain-containing protein n=1 Tax=Auriscalpium vulgare TaxID=40419 RepID=A0ACB8RB25_9AGAM|nr:SWIB-domain-containing protein [Auriscalpium vulgare]